MDILWTQVGPLTLIQWAIAVAVGWFAISALQAIFRKVEPETDKKEYMNMRCPGCGWLGTVSKFHRTCPKCGNQITPTTTMPSV